METLEIPIDPSAKLSPAPKLYKPGQEIVTHYGSHSTGRP